LKGAWPALARLRVAHDADRPVAAFAAQLKEAVDLDSVSHLAEVVHRALERAHVSVRISLARLRMATVGPAASHRSLTD